MIPISRVVRSLGMRIPTNLYVFVAAVFLANGVNLFNVVYGASHRPARSSTLLLSCAASLLAAVLWTVLASKINLIDKTAASASHDPLQRDSIREKLWNDVWRRVAGYLGTASLLSILTLTVLMLPTN
jgi:uncharacterized membrane protein